MILWSNMADLSFFKSKYTIDSMVNHYLDDIKKLKTYVKTPGDETKRQIYYQAANTFSRVSVKDIFQFAMSYGKEQSGKCAAMRNAFPTLLGNNITQASKVDVAYLYLLLAYSKEFKMRRANLKEWTLRFLFSSQFSPISSLFTREIENVITNTQRKISQYQSQSLS